MDDKTIFRGLKNIGPTIADRLESVGLKTLADLKKIGPAKVFNRVKNTYSDITIPVCYYLYSLHGALVGKHWNDLPSATKERLLDEAGVKHLFSRAQRVVRRDVHRRIHGRSSSVAASVRTDPGACRPTPCGHRPHTRHRSGP